MIGLHCPLPALTDDQIRPYLQHALDSGNISSGYSFSETAIQRIAFYSSGVPRLVNAITEVALAAAKLTGERIITAEKVVAAFVHLNIGAKLDNDTSPRSHREHVQSKPDIHADNQQLARQQRKIGNKREAKAESSIDASVNSNTISKGTLSDLVHWIDVPETASPTQINKAERLFDPREYDGQQNHHPLYWNKSAYVVLLFGLLGGAILTQRSDNEGRISVNRAQKQTQRAVKATPNALPMEKMQSTAGRYEETEPIVSDQALLIIRDSDKPNRFAGIKSKRIDPESKANVAVGNESTPVKNVPSGDRNSALYTSTTKDNSDRPEAPTKAKTRQPKAVQKIPSGRNRDTAKTARKRTPDKINANRSTGTNRGSDRMAGSNSDDNRPENQFNTDLFGRTLTIGGEYEFRPVFEGNFDLDSTEKDDLVFIDQFLILEFFYELSESTSLFVDGTTFFAADVYAEFGEREIVKGFERGEAWLLFENLSYINIDVQIGPQYFGEFRQWWWDDILDAARLYYYGDDFEIQLGIAETLAPISTTDDGIDPVQKDVTRVLGAASWEWTNDQVLELYFLSQTDHSTREKLGDIIQDGQQDEIDADLYWLGLRSMGGLDIDNGGWIDYWFDAAFVRGKETMLDFSDDESGFIVVDDIIQHDVSGWALDFGITWQTPFPMEPSFTVGYAIGSGDPNPESGDDKSFRQTGIQRNESILNGVNRFRYYGELLNPELSNLRILTASVGLPLFKNSSIEILFHDYDQVYPSSYLWDGNITVELTGTSRDIGQEIDVVLGLEEWEHLELEFVAGVFQAGDAYGSLKGKIAANLSLKIDYNF